jgi:HD-GYP domain-containing protein (c-di-GMP phosphodiesterase class II)
MNDTQALLSKIAALRQRLEQAQGLARDVGSVAAALPVARPHAVSRLDHLQEQAAAGSRHDALVDSALRQIPAADPAAGLDAVLPAQLTARAGRVLKNSQELLRQLRTLAGHPIMQNDDADPLAARHRETVAMTDTVLRAIQAFPTAPSAQLRMCEGLEVILGVVAERLANLTSMAQERHRQRSWLHNLAELLVALATGKEMDIKPFVRLADALLVEAQEGTPLRFFEASPQPALAVAAHSLNVAQVGARVVRHDPELRARALDPVLACLVHDVGMLKVPAEIFTQAGPLTNDQRRAVESHALTGAEMALRLLPTANWLAEAAAAHHERLDGTGYPSGLRDIQISPLSRLVAVCDVYAAMCGARPHRPASQTRTALTDTLLEAEQGRLDRHHAERLLHLSFYPVGTVVELADGAVAVVIATHQGRRELNTPARPVLAMLTDPQRRSLPAPRHVDLAESESYSIVRSLPAAERRELLGNRFPELV